MEHEPHNPTTLKGIAPRIIALTTSNHGVDELDELRDLLGPSSIVITSADSIVQKFDLYTGTMQGLFLSGDEDVDPDYYEYADEHAYETADGRINKLSPERRLIDYALNHQIPILATGHGCLELNEVMGGRTNLDVNVGLFSTIRHAAFEDYHGHRHQIFLSDEGPLKNWLGTESLRVNSQHHQAIKELASGLRPMAHAADGMIEGYFRTEGSFVVGLQFRPELMLHENSSLAEIFRQFVKACSKK